MKNDAIVFLNFSWVRIAFLIVISLLFSFEAMSQDKNILMDKKNSNKIWGVFVYLISSEFLLQKNESQNQYFQTQNLLSLGLQYQKFSVLIEKAHFSINDGNQTLHIKSEIDMISVMGRYAFISWKNLNLYAALGVGSHTEKVTTRLLGESFEDSSGSDTFMNLAFGTQVQYEFLTGELEMRATQAKYLDPTVAYGFLFRLGLLFKF